MARTIATILILSATAAVACACGGSRAASDAGARSAAAAATGPTASVGSGTPVPGAKVSAATLELGEAINLRRSDVPAMTQILPMAENATSNRGVKLACGRAASLFEEPGGLHSPTFTVGHLETARSAVRVAPSVGAAAHQLATNASASFLACYERFLRSLSRRLSAPPAISVSPLPGPSGSFGFRITRRPTSSVDRPIYTDTFRFAAGRVEVALTVSRASKPFPAATERGLLSLLLSRAKAHEL